MQQGFPWTDTNGEKVSLKKKGRVQGYSLTKQDSMRQRERRTSVDLLKIMVQSSQKKINHLILKRRKGFLLRGFTTGQM